MKRIAIIGAGGVGKSTLAGNFADFLKRRGLRAAVANLDPGCKHLGYEAFYDVRKKYDLEDVMRKSRLGPNGALRKIYEDLFQDEAERKKLRPGERADFAFLDTAGSLELFMLGKTGKELREVADAVIYVVEFEGVESEEDSVLLKAVSAVQELKYALPTLTVVNKSDLAKAGTQQKRLGGLAGFRAVNQHLRQLLEEVGSREKLVHASATEGKGFDELLDGLNELFCECGE